MPSNRLIKLNPVTSTTDTPEAGTGMIQKVSIPINGLTDGAGVAIDASDNIYISDYSKHVIYRYKRGDTASKIFAGAYGTSGSADGKGASARFNQPRAICVDRSGNVYVIDSGNNLIRKINQEGDVYTVASQNAEQGGDAPGHICVDNSGNIFLIDNT